MDGKIVVIEGIDGSGKTTQYKILKERLEQEDELVYSSSFPNYESKSCWFVKQYLSGTFGDNPGDVDAKTASLFFALDRYASYKMKGWGKAYRVGKNVLFSRYWTSNLLHQASKLNTEDEKIAFLEWLRNLEINELGLPEENAVIFLRLPFETCLRIKRERNHSDCGDKDIHEADERYLHDSWETANFFAKRLGWLTIECVVNGEMRSVREINDEVYGLYRKVVG